MNDIYNLKKGETYKVIKQFYDFDRQIHKIGETWIFEKIEYLPYHSGLSLFVTENGQNIMYRFQDVAEEQQPLLNDFMNFVKIVKV